MKNTDKQNLTVNTLLLFLLALFFLSAALMWSQHSQYHNQPGMTWMGTSSLHNVTMMPFNNNASN